MDKQLRLIHITEYYSVMKRMNDTDDPQKYYTKWKKLDTKGLHTVRFYLSEILEKANLW